MTKTDLFELIENLQPVDPSDLAEYETEMEQAIQQIINDVKKRRSRWVTTG